MASDIRVMKLVFIVVLFMLMACEQKIEVPGLNLANMSYSYCDTTWYDSAKITYSFVGKSVVRKEVTMYREQDCYSGYEASYEVREGKYEYSNASQDLKETKLTRNIKLISQDEVDQRNLESYCGFSDWSLNVQKNVTNLDCDGSLFVGGEINHYNLILNADSVIIDGITYYKN